MIVEGRLVDVAFDALEIGMAMRVVPLPFRLADGSLRTSFGFTADEGQGA